MVTCNKCGAPMAFNPRTQKNFCSAKCWLQPQQNMQGGPISAPNPPISAASLVINQTEKPHSYKFGPTNNRHKIYYAEVEDLLEQIRKLKEAELIIPIDFSDGEN